MKRTMIRDIPDNIHKDFKLMCVEKEVSMNRELLRLIKEEVERFRQHGLKK